MFNSSRRYLGVAVYMLVGMMFLSGCATRKWVRQEVGALEPRFSQLADADRENAERIDAVDQRAQQGIQNAEQRANQANQAAEAASEAAAAAARQAETANQGVQQATTRINTVETRIEGLDRYTPGPSQTVTFALDSATLSDQARSTLEGLANQVSGQQSGYLIEIQGFTDTTGDRMYNVNLSQRRAEAVLRYLVSQNVPLHRVSIIGLGPENPVADNTTREGREQNRRVEVRVLRSEGLAASN